MGEAIRGATTIASPCSGVFLVPGSLDLGSDKVGGSAYRQQDAGEWPVLTGFVTA